VVAAFKEPFIGQKALYSVHRLYLCVFKNRRTTASYFHIQPELTFVPRRSVFTARYELNINKGKIDFSLIKV